MPYKVSNRGHLTLLELRNLHFHWVLYQEKSYLKSLLYYVNGGISRYLLFNEIKFDSSWLPIIIFGP